LRNEFSDSGLVTDYRDWQIPLGRRFRALKIWFVMRTYGTEGLKNHIRNTVKLGELFCSMVQSRPDLFKVLTTPAFALTVFSVVPHPRSPASASLSQPSTARGAYSNSFTPDAASQALIDSNLLTKRVYEAVNSRAEVFITSVVVKGIYVIRVVSANPKAEEKYIRRAFEILVETAEEIRNEVGGDSKAP
jgi:aromatic-L-amino-acid decarboxylase